MQLKNSIQLGIFTVIAIVMAFAVHYNARATMPTMIGANPLPPQFLVDQTGVYDGGLTVTTFTEGYDGCVIFAHNSSTVANEAFTPYAVMVDGTIHQMIASITVGTNSWYQVTMGRNASGSSANVTAITPATFLSDSVPNKIEVVGAANEHGIWRFVLECGL